MIVGRARLGYDSRRTGKNRAGTSGMTAVDEFQRLEATGLYQPDATAQRRDVIVALGKASLTIVDQSSSALAHWSLPAVRRNNPGRMPAIYTPGPEAEDLLEIADETMVRAIDKVMNAVERERPHPRRLRSRLMILGALAVIALGVFWLPGALVRYTTAILPEAKRTEIGDSLLRELTRVSGTPCVDPAGRAALETLGRGIGLDPVSRLAVVPSGIAETAHLPGGIILLGRAVVEDFESPEVVAGYLLAEAERRAMRDPMEPLLQNAGLGATLKLTTTGNLPQAALRRYAERLVSEPMTGVPTDALVARFATAEVSALPYAEAIDITGESTSALVAQNPVALEKSRSLMGDADWVALQQICGG